MHDVKRGTGHFRKVDSSDIRFPFYRFVFGHIMPPRVGLAFRQILSDEYIVYIPVFSVDTYERADFFRLY